MRSIPQRQAATLQNRVVAKNAIGEHVETWADVATLRGVLDMVGGGTGYGTFSAKLMESTHVFIADYVSIAHDATECRMIINGGVYDVTMIDDPCGLHDHLEIYLTFKGVA